MNGILFTKNDINLIQSDVDLTKVTVGTILYEDCNYVIVTDPRIPTKNESVFDVYGNMTVSHIFKHSSIYLEHIEFYNETITDLSPSYYLLPLKHGHINYDELEKYNIKYTNININDVYKYQIIYDTSEPIISDYIIHFYVYFYKILINFNNDINAGYFNPELKIENINKIQNKSHVEYKFINYTKIKKLTIQTFQKNINYMFDKNIILKKNNCDNIAFPCLTMFLLKYLFDKNNIEYTVDNIQYYFYDSMSQQKYCTFNFKTLYEYNQNKINDIFILKFKLEFCMNIPLLNIKTNNTEYINISNQNIQLIFDSFFNNKIKYKYFDNNKENFNLYFDNIIIFINYYKTIFTDFSKYNYKLILFIMNKIQIYNIGIIIFEFINKNYCNNNINNDNEKIVIQKLIKIGCMCCLDFITINNSDFINISTYNDILNEFKSIKRKHKDD